VALVAAALIIVAVAGGAILSGVLIGPGPTPSGTPRPWVPEPTPDERYVKISNLFFMDASGRHLMIEFAGAQPYKFYDPCSTDYAATARITSGVLEVGVVQSNTQRPTLAPSCEMTTAWQLQVELAEPFTGSVWRDLYGPYIHFLVAPPGLVTLTGLPSGWELRQSNDADASPGGTWLRTYSPDPRLQDPTRVVLFYQSFGGPLPSSAFVFGGSESRHVKVGDADATLYRAPAAGWLTLAWRFRDDGLALMANEQDFSVEALINLAESGKTP
jgi:hypothetical protein